MVTDAIEYAFSAIDGLRAGIASPPAGFDAALRVVLSLQGKVVTTGVGTSGIIARRFAHLLTDSGVPALFVHATELLNGAGGVLTPHDALYLISKSAHGNGLGRLPALAEGRGSKLVVQAGCRPPWLEAHNVLVELDFSQTKDLLGLVATGSSLLNALVCDMLCWSVCQQRQTVSGLRAIHPEGGVGLALSVEPEANE
ncbi:MAG: hypothetical protein JST93_26180 [Acidobacteria bacterium]|nr:hypothetical protein [Acidobacteriota bacterium]